MCLVARNVWSLLPSDETTNAQIPCYGTEKLEIQQLKHILKDSKTSPWFVKKFSMTHICSGHL
jgi:hypothetical protein